MKHDSQPLFRPNRSDEELITLSQRDDHEAFGLLYERYLDKIYRYIFYRLSNHQDAEDLTEAVFIRAWGAIKRYRIQGTPFLAWLYRIAHNIVIDHRRAKKIEQVDLESQFDLPDEAESVEDRLDVALQVDSMQTAIALLDPAHQEVLTLRFFMGLSHKETAEIIGRNPGAVRVLQHRALHALRVQMAKES